MINKVYYALETGAFTDAYAQGLRIATFNFPKPAVKTTTVNVPGRNGLIDLSESLTGYPTYENINGSVTFIVLKGASFNLNTFINTYHGRIMRLYTDEDTMHYYIGRGTVTAKTLRLGKLQTFTLTVNAEPFLWSTSETNQTFNVKTGSISGFTTVSSSNMASGYPTIASKNVTLKAATTSGGNATISAPVDNTKLYVLACTMNDYCDKYEITTGNGTVTGTQLIKPASGDTTVSIKFYTTESTSAAVFGNVCLIPLQEVQRETTAVGFSAPYFTSPRACNLYIFENTGLRVPAIYTLAASTPVYTPDVNVLKQNGTQTGIYVGMGLASANDTGRLWYRRGFLA